MKKLIVLLSISLLMCSCEKDDSSSEHKLKNCSVEYLFFYDNIYLSDFYSVGFPPSDEFACRCSYTYAGSKVVKSVGGFVVVPSGGGFGNYMFSTDAYDSISHDGNTISVYAKYKAENTIQEFNYNPIVFSFNSEDKLQQITIRNANYPDGYNLNYTYSDNRITETYDNGDVYRTFYFENGNLVKVVREQTNEQGVVVWKKEILFNDFDSNPNPFKGLCYVRGAFFRSFSNNNYQGYTVKIYSQQDDGSLTLVSTYTYSMPITYNGDGYPEFGDY